MGGGGYRPDKQRVQDRDLERDAVRADGRRGRRLGQPSRSCGGEERLPPILSEFKKCFQKRGPLR